MRASKGAAPESNSGRASGWTLPASTTVEFSSMASVVRETGCTALTLIERSGGWDAVCAEAPLANNNNARKGAARVANRWHLSIYLLIGDQTANAYEKKILRSSD